MGGYESEGEDIFYEIEYDSGPMPGVGRFVQRSRKIAAPERDAVRERFERMRDLARAERSSYYGSSRFYDSRVQRENSKIFYKQGKFMEDFEDDCPKAVPCSAYFVNYQMLGYDQLRTYFTWRTKVRQGEIQNISLSYAFLYLYELLNNIGVEGPREGLDALMDFWDVFRNYDGTIDKYMLRWLKDYHIYYELPWSFKEFRDKNSLGRYYPELSEPGENFDLFCAISKYDIRKSAFFTEERKELVRECFRFTMDALGQAMEEKGMDLDGWIFHSTKKMPQWTPFKDALFYPCIPQRDRKVVLSEKEIYLCRQNNWSCSTVITMESGKGLIGYVMKQMEAVLRKAAGYKYKLSANSNMVSGALMDELNRADISLENIVRESALAFYREAVKTVVKIDPGALDRIRKEAWDTQEKLIVPEEEKVGERPFPVEEKTAEERLFPAEKKLAEARPFSVEKELAKTEPFPAEEEAVCAGEESIAAEGAAFEKKESGTLAEKEAVAEDRLWAGGSASEASPWKAFGDALEETEKQALLTAMAGETVLDREAALRRLADERGIMLEVLIDGINEKAIDYVGDSLLDEELAVYEDYAAQVEKLLRE